VTQQLEFDLDPPRRPKARRTDPGTSRKHLETLNTGTIAAAVYGELRTTPGGLTSLELAMILPWSRVSISPMLKPMEEAGWIQRTGEVRNGGIVWRSKK
jgi:DNA-binding MarR family transcriptional regulator